MQEFRCKADNIITKDVHTKDGNQFCVYAIEIGDAPETYVIDITMLRTEKESFAKGLDDANNVFFFDLKVRAFNFNGRLIHVPNARFVKVEMGT